MAEKVQYRKMDFDYARTAEAHFVRCGRLLNGANEVAEVFWAALELRMCLERLALEYLTFLTLGKRELSKSELKRFQPGKIFPRLHKEVPYFEKMVEFVNEVFRLHEQPGVMKFPNMKWFDSTYGRLSDYLHRQADPLSELELVNFANFVATEYKRTRDYVMGRAKIGELRSHAEDIFQKYVAGEIDKDQMRRRLELSNIPIHQQNPE